MSFEKTKEFIAELDAICEKRKKEINESFDMEYLEKAFTPEELYIMQSMGIENLEQLYHANLGSFKGVIPTPTKENIEMLKNILYYKGDDDFELSPKMR